MSEKKETTIRVRECNAPKVDGVFVNGVRVDTPKPKEVNDGE